MPLFPDVPRHFMGPSTWSESEFGYYARSGRPYAARVRALIEEWFTAYPRAHQEELRAGFESNFNSAFFELTICALLQRLGCTVDVHPQLANTGSLPDFLATPNDGSEPFYVEAVVVEDMSDEQRRFEEWKRRYLDAFNTLEYPRLWFLMNGLDGKPRGPFPVRRVRDFIDSLVSSVDPAVLKEKMDDPNAREVAAGTFMRDGVSFRLTILTRPASLRGNTDVRPLASSPGGVAWGDRSPSLISAIDRKATGYGVPDHPFVVAVNALSRWGVDEPTIYSALVGELNEGAIFYHKGAVQNTRLTGVLVAFALYPTNVPVCPAKLYLHPEPARELAGPLLRLPKALVVQRQFVSTSGLSLGDVLGLPDTWVPRTFTD
jgi:hypothetical protein